MKNPIQSITRAAAAMLLLFSTPALAQVPDLTNGGAPTAKDLYRNNLGPTRGGDRGHLASAYNQLSEEDMLVLSGTIVESVAERAPADGMQCHLIQYAGAKLLTSYGYAEAVPLSKNLTDYYAVTKPGFIDQSLVNLDKLAGSSLLVEPDPKILEWADDLLYSLLDPDAIILLDSIIASINADTNPQALPALKALNFLTVDSPTLTLPANKTVLRLDSINYSGESIFTWRKVHGPGKVTFAPVFSPDDGSRTVIFDGIPGNYLFEVVISDSDQLTEVKQTIAVRLEQQGGGLPANSPPVANPQSLTVNQGAALPIILTASDPEGYELNHSITSEPIHGRVSGTPPFLTYVSKSGYIGIDSFDFEVMDSEGQVSSATISITVNDSSPLGVAIYEPFNYPIDSSLNGQSGSGDVGFAAPWVATKGKVSVASLGNDEILTKGGLISAESNEFLQTALSARLRSRIGVC